MSRRSKMITALFTDLCGFGGIPRVSQHAGAILHKLADESNEVLSILSLNDPHSQSRFRLNGSTFSFRSYGRRRLSFIGAALAKCFRSRLIYLAHPNLAPLGLVVKLLRPSTRYVVATYGLDVWQRLPLLRRISLRFADCVITISNFTAKRLVSVQKIDRARVVIVPCAVHPSLLASGSQMNGKGRVISEESKVLLTVGRMWNSERLKGMDNVIRILPRVNDVVPDTHYFIVGEGDDQTRLQKLAEANGVARYVHFVGASPDDDDLCRYYDACDAFVMPSKQEGFGLVFLEAMARSKPVIAANYGGAPDIVVHNETGFLVEYEDLDSLADRIVELLREPELSRKMGTAGRERVEENFTFGQLEKRMTDLLNRLTA